MMHETNGEFFTLFDKIELLLVSGKFEEAIMECSAVLEKNPKDGIRYYRGKALNRLGRFDKAAADLTKALEYGVRSAYLFAERSVALRAIGEHEKAGEDFETALRLAGWSGGDEEMNNILQEGVKIMTDMAEELAHLERLLKPLIKDATRIIVETPIAMPEHSNIKSHFGGQPYFEKGEEWPKTKNGKRLEFVFQIFNENNIALPENIKLINVNKLRPSST